MTTDYRTGVRRCAACGDVMVEVEVQPRGDLVALVDVCNGCGAAFFDFEDGEPRALVRALPAIALHPDRGGVAHGCPACGVPLYTAAFPREGGVIVSRCGQCGGLFAPRDVQDALADVGDPDEPRTKSFFARLLALLGVRDGGAL